MDRTFMRLLVVERIGKFQAEAERERVARSSPHDRAERHVAGADTTARGMGAVLRWRLTRG